MSSESPADGEVDFAAITRRCLCLQSRMAARAVTRYYNARLAPLSLEITEFSLLASLAQARDSSITELADRLAFERTTLVRNLKRIEQRGLIALVTGHGRAIRYVLTKRGERILRQAVPLWAEAQTALEQRLNADDDAEVYASLNALLHASRPG